MLPNENNKRSMENTELKHILIAYKSTNIGLQQAHDEVLRLFGVVGQSEQLHTEVFNLANKLAVNGYGDEAVKMHRICNGM